MKNQSKLTLLVPVKDEQANLRRCLESVEWIDEVFVIDSKSKDGTEKIALEFGAKVVQFEYSGGWPKKKNWALENLAFSNDWVLILDADECLPPEAEKEINKIVCDPNPEHDGYWSTGDTFFWAKSSNMRISRIGIGCSTKLGRYEKIIDVDTNSGDNEVHEHVVVQGSTEKLKSIMDHHAFPTIESFVEKHNRYSNWGCESSTIDDEESLQHSQVKGKRRLDASFASYPSDQLFASSMYTYGKQAFSMDGKGMFSQDFMPNTNSFLQQKHEQS